MSLTHSVWSPAHQQLAQHPTMASSLLNQGEALPWMRSWRDGNPTTTTSQDPWSQGCMTRPCWSRAWRMQTRDFALHLWPFRSCRGSPRAEHSASFRGASSCNPVARSASSTTATLEARVPGLPTTTSWCCAVLCDRHNTSQWLQHPWLGRHGTPVLSTIISRVEERIGPMPTGTHQFQRLNPFAAWYASGTQPGVHQHSKSTTPSSLDCRLQLRLSIATPDWLRLWGGDCSGAWPVSTLMTPTSLTGVPQKGMDSTVSNSSMPCWGPHLQPKSDKRCRQKVFSWGLHHNLQHVRQGFVTFWPRERLIEKMQTFVLDALASSQLTSGTASKIYGMMNFLEQGIYGRIGCSGLCAIKERQQETSRKMTPALQESLTLILEVLKLRPLREMEVIHRPVDRFVAASDAALEAPFEGSGGFLIVWFNGDTQQRHAFVSDIPRSVYDIFTPGEKKIAQLELIQIIYALVHCSSQFRGRRGIWYLDNTAALMVLIRGRSDSADLERMAQIIHCLMFGLRCWFFFEWIESKSNWADAISRLGFQDPWYQGQGFSAAEAFFPSELWHLRLADLIRVAEFL